MSWVNQIISTVNSHKLIDNVSILYDFVSSDHHPILVDFNCNISGNNSETTHTDIQKKGN